MASNKRPKSRSRHPLRSDTLILLAVGFFLVAGGIALVVAPEYSPRARSLASDLDRFSGIQSGVLMLGGLVFFSLGALSRGITKLNSTVRIPHSRPKPEENVDVSLVVEQLAEEMVQLRTAVQQVSGDVAKTSQTLQHLLQKQEALAKVQGAPREQGEGQQPLDSDPLFLMAGSLDQMNARLDERLNALTARVDEGLANLRAS